MSIVGHTKMNIGKTGVTGFTLGKRGTGLSLSTGKKGTWINIGIPGTGLSKRIRLDSGPEDKSGRLEHRRREREKKREKRRLEKERIQEEKEDAKERKIEENKELVRESEEELEILQSIFEGREKNEFDWKTVSTPPEPYEIKEFTPPELPPLPKPFDEDKVKSDFKAGYLGMNDYESLLKRYEGEFEGSKIIQKEIYDKFIEDSEEEFNKKEKKIKRAITKQIKIATELSTAEDDDNPEPLAQLLEDELDNEELPFEMEFEIEFDGVTKVTIYLMAPSSDLIPEWRYSVSPKLGKLSEKEVGVRERNEIYEYMISGLTLRLVYETFRVLPMVKNVAIEGNFEKSDVDESCALDFSITRMKFNNLETDDVDPYSVIEEFGKIELSI